MSDLPRVHEHEHEHEHESPSEAKVRRWVDYLGAGVGLLCAVHCALTPLPVNRHLCRPAPLTHAL